MNEDISKCESTNGAVKVSGKIKVNKVIYCTLALFLGDFGFHKFYAKKFGQFILFLLFCWTFIPALISIFNFWGALFESSDENGNILI